MPDTFIKIASVTVGSGGASSISFSSIPSIYTDLVIKLSARSEKTGQPDEYPVINFNGSGSNFTGRYLYGNGSGAGSNTSTLLYSVTNANGATSNTFGNSEFYIPNYAGSNYKSVSADGVSENNATTALALLTAGLWSVTSAITSITLSSAYGNNWMQYTTATLYGIKNS